MFSLESWPRPGDEDYEPDSEDEADVLAETKAILDLALDLEALDG